VQGGEAVARTALTLMRVNFLSIIEKRESFDASNTIKPGLDTIRVEKSEDAA